ncbi:hypothetical protein WDV85_16655, partial [Pseudokineococcus sp. 5B2Z-1]|uniref:hypothetical protein n=1 Tax=Pseudokineococcus sp. 5B2Z-1 TaxID=3132744 RepID=UPI0030B77F74
MAFKVFEKTSAPLAKVPTVTIQKARVFSISRSAHALIDSPAHVELLWDPERSIVGFRATEETNPNAFATRSTSDTAPVIVAGAKFIDVYKIDASVSRRWVAYEEDGILCVDISEPGTLVTSNRSGRGASG